MQRDVSRCGGKVPVIVAATVAPTGLAALVPGRLRQFLCFRLQQFVERFLHTAPNQFFNLPLDYFLVQLYNLL